MRVCSSRNSRPVSKCRRIQKTSASYRMSDRGSERLHRAHQRGLTTDTCIDACSDVCPVALRCRMMLMISSEDAIQGKHLPESCSRCTVERPCLGVERRLDRYTLTMFDSVDSNFDTVIQWVLCCVGCNVPLRKLSALRFTSDMPMKLSLSI